MALSTSDIIIIAKISQYMAANDLAKGAIFQQHNLDPLLPSKLYTERVSLEWQFNHNPNDSNITGYGNFVYSMCLKYLQNAKTILNAQAGGYSINYTTRSYIPVTPPPPIEVKVGGSGPNDSKAPIAGTSIWVLPEFAGYYVELTWNKVPQVTDSTYDGTFFTKPLASNTLTISPGTWQTGDDLIAKLYADPLLISTQMSSGSAVGGSSIETVNTYAQISSRTDTRLIIVLADETNANQISYYVYSAGILKQLLTT